MPVHLRLYKIEEGNIMTALTSTEWSLAARPVGMPKLSDFQMKTIPTRRWRNPGQE